MFVNSETDWNNGYVPKNGSVNYILKTMEVSKRYITENISNSHVSNLERCYVQGYNHLPKIAHMFSFQTPSTLSKWWWNRSLRFPPLENNSHIYYTNLIHNKKNRLLSAVRNPNPIPIQKTPLRSWTYRLASRKSSQCIGIAACHLTTTDTQEKPNQSWWFAAKCLGDFREEKRCTLFGGSLHNWFLDPEGKAP